jgi:hypothetical protein
LVLNQTRPKPNILDEGVGFLARESISLGDV